MLLVNDCYTTIQCHQIVFQCKTIMPYGVISCGITVHDPTWRWLYDVNTSSIKPYNESDESYDIMMWYDVTWCHVTSKHCMTPYDITRHFMTSHNVMWRRMTSCGVIWRRVTSYDVVWRPMTSCDVVWRHVMSEYLRFQVIVQDEVLSKRCHSAGDYQIIYYM